MAKGLLTSYVSVVIVVCLKLCTCVPNEDLNSEAGTLTLNNLNAKYAEDIAVLKKEMNSLQERVTKLEMKSSSKKKVDDHVIKENPNVHVLKKRGLPFWRLRRAPEIAFQASLAKDYATVELNDAIIFNEVLTNTGGAYNKHTGIFTVPLAGTYIFNTNIVSEKGHYVEACIQVNNKATVCAISDHRISSNEGGLIDIWDQGNAVAILRLRKGDKVLVAVQWPEGSHDIHGVGKSSFSGYLLRAHHSNMYS